MLTNGSPSRYLFVLCVTSILYLCAAHGGHEDVKGPQCESISTPLVAPYVPGTITIDGNATEWESIEGQEYKLLQAINPDPKEPYPQGTNSMLVKAVHDGQNLYLLLTVPGTYVFDASNERMAASVALMFGIGDDATFYNMGGCPILPPNCNAEVCEGHEVDLVHWELASAIPGRLYGGNLEDNLARSGKDSVGSLNDLTSWNPHCRQYDGGPGGEAVNISAADPTGAQNDWHGAWSHTSISNQYGLRSADAPYSTLGNEGHFVFEFTRPLRTPDRIQQDAQFAIGGSHRFGAAFWYPVDSQPWLSYRHYVTSCDWVPLELHAASPPARGWSTASSADGLSNTAAASVSALALLVAVAAIFVSIVVGWWVRANARQFTPMELAM